MAPIQTTNIIIIIIRKVLYLLSILRWPRASLASCASISDVSPWPNLEAPVLDLDIQTCVLDLEVPVIIIIIRKVVSLLSILIDGRDASLVYQCISDV